MTSYIAVDLRRSVEQRANHQCEYCLIREPDTYLGCQVDHIIAEKHGGNSELDNLSLACTFCNQAKGTDIGSIAPSTGSYTRFFHPRTDKWEDHFELQGATIHPRTPVGEATAFLLRFNEPERLLEREALIRCGNYPSPSS